MKVALAQINPLVGDIDGNTDKIIRAAARAADAGADLVIAPELAVIGYPPKDLLLKDHLIERNVAAIQRIAAASDRVAIVAGFAEPNTNARGKPLRNAAALCVGGRVLSVHGKRLLPTYDVFDEHRYFDPADGPAIASLDLPGCSHTVGFSICEDLWNYEAVNIRQPYTEDPIAELVQAGAGILFNISASPYALGKQEARVRIFSAQAARHRVPIVYVNQVGGNDDLIFDGASAVFSADGTLVAQARAFVEDLLIVDLNHPDPGDVVPYPDGMDGIYEALILGTRDYVAKCGFTDTVLGLSGGIDSAVAAAIAAAALGPERVHGVALPSRYSSDHSLTDAELLARNLGIDFRVISIEKIHRATEEELAPHFAGLPPGIAEENIQARTRGNLLMSLSNKHGWLLLTTGNKSELAVGYCTLYGDMCGGLAVISDVPKTMVYDLARYINQRAGREIIPSGTLTKPPSAELREDQTDQDSLPPYEILDPILQLYVEQEQSVDRIVAQGFDPHVVKDVVHKVDRNEYKRKQTAVGLKVTSRAFGTGRRVPIAARYT
ncbi:MAG TPA: NAD+ synthase [Phycisphaerae bacterium]|nr:NAD+ synthase [Phycisphaerae bacterium]